MRVLSLGDRAFTVEFADGFDDAARAAVVALDTAITEARAAGTLPGVVDVAPTFRSLTVYYDPLETSRAALEPLVVALCSGDTGQQARAGAVWTLPVHYGGEAGPDLEPLAREAGLTPDDAVALHSETEVSVHMLGFLPGFAFLGDIDPALHKPRLKEPRLRVPAGSVAVADRLTAIYPWESPGGWHLIGHCPVPLFDTRRDRPSLLAPGDRVRFEPVSADRHGELVRDLADGALSVDVFLGAP